MPWTRLVGTATFAFAFATANNGWANPPFINLLYPPPGIAAPREDAAAPHALPPYPAHAAVCKETGQVKLQLTIGANGNVSDVQIVTSSGFADLDASALTTARRWRYAPAKKDNTPMAVQIATSIEFPPEDKPPSFEADCTAAGMKAAVETIMSGS
jgi:TonB family protein